MLLRLHGGGTDTEIRVSTESRPWRRKFSRRSSRDSNTRPFNHESGALTTEPSLLPISQLRTKYSSSNCPNHVRRTMSSIKKRSKVRRILQTMFGEANVRPVKNGIKGPGVQDESTSICTQLLRPEAGAGWFLDFCVQSATQDQFGTRILVGMECN